MSRLDELDEVCNEVLATQPNWKRVEIRADELKQMIQIMRQMRIACQTVTHQFYHRQCEEALAALDKFDKGD